MDLYISTTGTVAIVSLTDLGGREFVHPTSDLELTLEYSIEEIRDSYSVDDALVANYITLRDETGKQYSSTAEIDEFNQTSTSINNVEVDSSSIGDAKVLSFDQNSNTIVYVDTPESLSYDSVSGGTSWNDNTLPGSNLVNGGDSW